jgi:hypothetical protein
MVKQKKTKKQKSIFEKEKKFHENRHIHNVYKHKYTLTGCTAKVRATRKETSKFPFKTVSARNTINPLTMA